MESNRQFTCQECKQPIFIDSSLADLSPSAYDILQSSLPSRPTASPSGSRKQKANLNQILEHIPASPAVKAAWSKAQQEQKPEQSYVLLQDSVLKDIPAAPVKAVSPGTVSSTKQISSERGVASMSTKPTALSHQLNSQAKLFALLSSRTDVDHPLCEECSHVLLTSLTKKLEETKRERDGYLAFERELRKEREREKASPSEKDLDAEIEKLRLEERQAIGELQAAEAERQVLERELRELEEEGIQLTKEEDDFFSTYNSQLIKAAHQDAALASLQASIQHSSALLSRLEKTNVYADAFSIGVEGPFGTINGLRFGRSGSQSALVLTGPVEWAEVNAAWGLVVLCLKTIARKVECDLRGYTLNPLASTSTITHQPASKNKAETNELYFSDDINFGRVFHNRRFDSGMVMFLDCLRIVMDHVQTLDPSLEFPNLIQKDRIGDMSIKLQFSQEENWTRALRNVLLTLKILLRWMTNAG